MNIELLSDKLYEDLNGQITRVEHGDSLEIYFECNDWDDLNSIRKFKITCVNVLESEIQSCFSGEIEFTEKHHLLWKHNEPHGYLYYSSEPENSYEVLGRIWEAHEIACEGWRPLSDFINTGHNVGFCNGQNGQLAHGPLPLLNAYQKAINGKMKTNYVPSYQPKGGLKVLMFDTCFVVCKSLVIEEVYS